MGDAMVESRPARLEVYDLSEKKQHLQKEPETPPSPGQSSDSVESSDHFVSARSSAGRIEESPLETSDPMQTIQDDNHKKPHFPASKAIESVAMASVDEFLGGGAHRSQEKKEEGGKVSVLLTDDSKHNIEAYPSSLRYGEDADSETMLPPPTTHEENEVQKESCYAEIPPKRTQKVAWLHGMEPALVPPKAERFEKQPSFDFPKPPPDDLWSPPRGKKERSLHLRIDSPEGNRVDGAEDKTKQEKGAWLKLALIFVVVSVAIGGPIFFFMYSGSTYQSWHEAGQCRLRLQQDYYKLRNLTEAGTVVSGCRLLPSQEGHCMQMSFELKQRLESAVPFHEIDAVCAGVDRDRLFAYGRHFRAAEERVWIVRSQNYKCFYDPRGFAKDCFGRP
ncbi:hypothetical protein QR680_012473 [Steinernema hermaphroditum]|uniref:Uncharacterized protein n=1 Tax=Steinernema hermaphroditum TaxID=289476 RepID=A0AA39I253_9BILA|nr:hypothetical protein QR680_012473 [Steinernema hermaphroditum]